jgi:hypothetical protein
MRNLDIMDTREKLMLYTDTGLLRSGVSSGVPQLPSANNRGARSTSTPLLNLKPPVSQSMSATTQGALASRL